MLKGAVTREAVPAVTAFWSERSTNSSVLLEQPHSRFSAVTRDAVEQGVRVPADPDCPVRVGGDRDVSGAAQPSALGDAVAARDRAGSQEPLRHSGVHAAADRILGDADARCERAQLECVLVSVRVGADRPDHRGRDGRISNAELAERVGLSLSPSPCLRRVRRLERTGVIRGYRAVIDPAAIGRSLRVLVGARIVRHARADVVSDRGNPNTFNR